MIVRLQDPCAPNLPRNFKTIHPLHATNGLAHFAIPVTNEAQIHSIELCRPAQCTDAYNLSSSLCTYLSMGLLN